MQAATHEADASDGRHGSICALTRWQWRRRHCDRRRRMHVPNFPCLGISFDLLTTRAPIPMQMEEGEPLSSPSDGSPPESGAQEQPEDQGAHADGDETRLYTLPGLEGEWTLQQVPGAAATAAAAACSPACLRACSRPCSPVTRWLNLVPTSPTPRSNHLPSRAAGGDGAGAGRAPGGRAPLRSAARVLGRAAPRAQPGAPAAQLRAAQAQGRGAAGGGGGAARGAGRPGAARAVRGGARGGARGRQGRRHCGGGGAARARGAGHARRRPARGRGLLAVSSRQRPRGAQPVQAAGAVRGGQQARGAPRRAALCILCRRSQAVRTGGHARRPLAGGGGARGGAGPAVPAGR